MQLRFVRKTRLAGVEILAKMEFLSALAFSGFGLALLLSAELISSVPYSLGKLGEEKLVMLGWNYLILGILSAIIGISIYSMREFGRRLALILAIVTIVIIIIGLFYLSMLIGIIDIILNTVVIIYLTRRKVVYQYRGRGKGFEVRY